MALLSMILLQALPYTAEAAASAVTACRVFDSAQAMLPDGRAERLAASCGGKSVILGPTPHYTTVANPVNGSVLLVRIRGDKNEVLLISPSANKTGVEVTALTATLIRAAGGLPNSGLDPATIDTSRFPVDASIGVTGTNGEHRIDLTSYIARALHPGAEQ